MNVNKKFGRLKQWGKEKMGGDIPTTASDDFKSLETEMNLRHEGMQKLQNSMNIYVKYLSKRTEGDGKEKVMPIAFLGSTMTKHGEDFEDGSKFGECLLQFGQANERINRLQESYAATATTCWLDGCERSLAQMKDYQNARKRLDSRRLAYDASLARSQKAKKDDFRAEEELRSQKAKFDESQDEVMRRMNDIIDAENDNVVDMYTFLEAELDYYDRSREILLNLKNNWPTAVDVNLINSRRPPSSRSNTLNRLPTPSTIDGSDLDEPKLPFRTSRASSAASATSSPRHDLHSLDQAATAAQKPSFNRAATSDNPARPQLPSRTLTETRHQLKPVTRTPDVFNDPADGNRRSRSPVGYDEQTHLSASPAPPQSRHPAAALSHPAPQEGTPRAKKPAPPPPPSRSTKPAPPPPPMKRSALSMSTVPYA